MTSPTHLKKFYKQAEAGPAPGGYVVRLDGKPLMTPLKKTLLLPARSLAEAVAQEWAEQGAEIRPAAMPLTGLANTLADKALGPERPALEAQVLNYGGSDLVCYFAAHPPPLVKRQQAQWQPLLRWLQERHGIALETVTGIQYHTQPAEMLHALKKLIAGLDAADFTVLQAATAVTGSLVIALALLERELSPEQAWQAACVDEIYQLETWGEDAEARRRLDALRAELESLARFHRLLRTTN